MDLALIIGLAMRNLTRNLRRTLITSAAVIAGVAVLIIGQGLVDGLDENAIRAQEDTVSSHVLLRPTDYPTDGLSFPLDQARPLSDALRAALQDSAVVAWAPRLWFQARLIDGQDSMRVRVIGYDPQAEDAVFPRQTWRVEGAWPEEGQIALGSGLASVLEAEVGQSMVLEARTLPGAINALSYPVSGIISAGSPPVDSLALWMPLATAEQLVLPGEARSHIAVRLKRRGLGEQAVETLSVGGWHGTTVLEEVADLLALNAFRRRMISLLVFILMAIAATGIANTVIMAAYERVREIGTLRAMGMSQPSIRALFIIEGGMMGLAAGILGAGLGTAVVWWFSRNGIDLSGLTDNLGELSMASTLYMQFSWGPVIFSLAFGLIISVLASVYPAQHAATLNPADAVRAD